jgi:hypothetical protein
MHYKEPRQADSLYFHVVDTTLIKKGVYLYYVEATSLGKTVRSETAMAHNLGLLDKPRFLHFKAVPLDDRKAVRLEWQLNYTETVKSISLYRSNKYKDGYVKITDLGPDETAYVDVVPLANEPWFYFAEIHNYFGGDRRSVRVPAFATFAETPFPPQDVEAEVQGDSIVFNWRNVGDNITGFRVYRSLDGKPFEQLSEMEPAFSKQIHYADKDKRLKDAVDIRYVLRNVSDGFVESKVTDTLRFYMPQHKPVYPPVQADGVEMPGGRIKIIWIPDERGFITGYNVYLKKPDGKILRLNDRPLGQNHYTDSIYRPAGKYEYQIEGVNFDKVSAGRTAVTVYRRQEIPQVILDLKKVKGGLEISWKKPAGNRTDKLVLYKKTGSGKTVAVKTYDAGKDGKYFDKYVKRGGHYMYFMKAVMKDKKKLQLNNQVEITY